MKATLFGIQKLDFSAPDGNQVKGLKLHYFYDEVQPNKNLAGSSYDKIFVRPDFAGDLFGYKALDIFSNFDVFRSSIKLPCEVDLDYDLQGRKAIFTGANFIKSAK